MKSIYDVDCPLHAPKSTENIPVSAEAYLVEWDGALSLIWESELRKGAKADFSHVRPLGFAYLDVMHYDCLSHIDFAWIVKGEVEYKELLMAIRMDYRSDSGLDIRLLRRLVALLLKENALDDLERAQKHAS